MLQILTSELLSKSIYMFRLLLKYEFAQEFTSSIIGIAAEMLDVSDEKKFRLSPDIYNFLWSYCAVDTGSDDASSDML